MLWGFSSVQSLSRVWLFATSEIAARQASLSFTISQSLLKLTYIESVMPSSHLILSSPSPPAPNPSQHQSLFQWVNSSPEVAKVAQIINSLLQKLKKVGKTTRPFRYELNQIPYDYTVEVTNRFKGLDMIECVKNYGWRFVTLYRRQGSRPSPRKRNAKRQNGCLRRTYK